MVLIKNDGCETASLSSSDKIRRGATASAVIAQFFKFCGIKGRSMYMAKYSFLALAAIALASCATTGDGGKWTCTAPGIMNSSYDGSDSAFVQLQGFTNGHNYEVVKNNQGNEATGTTANGTRFVCKKAR